MNNLLLFTLVIGMLIIACCIGGLLWVLLRSSRQFSQVQVAYANSCNLDRVMESLQPHLLTDTEEEQFRDSFNSLYPTALHRLRTACPKVTRSDELMCMLIVLKQTNEEIARALGISRPSVLQTRYRLRCKLNLPEGADFDTEVRQMMN